jgi:WD40 repeat protein/biotin carboxyl carrier protein
MSMRYVLAGIVVLGMSCYGAMLWHGQRVSGQANPAQEAPGERDESAGADPTPLYAARSITPVPFGPASVEPIVVPDCRLSVFEKRDVPSQREGVLQIIGTELKPGEKAPGDRAFRLETDHGPRHFRRLKEGDAVEVNQLLGILDDRLVRADLASKKARVAAAKAELISAEKTVAEARARYENQLRLFATKACSADEVRSAKLIAERQEADSLVKTEAVNIAELEFKQTETLLGMHEIRSPIAGVIKSVFKKDGEGVKALETVFQIHSLGRLRIEGLLEVEYLPYIRQGAKFVAEHAPAQGAALAFRDHLLPITGVAVLQHADQSWIISASEDASVRVYDRRQATPLAVFWHPAPVRCVACSPPNARPPVCVTGDSEGAVRLWDLDKLSAEPLRVGKEAHRGPVNCLALSPDGAYYCTGGEDREICIWEIAGGTMVYRFPQVHRAAITSVQFTPDAGLVSASRDNTLCVWKLTNSQARLETTLDRRSGDVSCPGVSADGQYVFFDQGRTLRLMRIKDRTTRCQLENPAEASHFTTFAMFSPDHRMLVTACAAEGQLQLWRAPTPAVRSYRVRNLVTRQGAPPTCAAFAPDASYLVTGTQDHQVLVWPLPDREELDQRPSADLTLLERAVESGSRQVRIWAEVANPQGRLLPGTSVTLAIYP